jgi:hypothetical protein
MYKKYYIFRKGRCGGRIFMVLKKTLKSISGHYIIKCSLF